jgi:hypothetical protein
MISVMPARQSRLMARFPSVTMVWGPFPAYPLFASSANAVSRIQRTNSIRLGPDRDPLSPSGIDYAYVNGSGDVIVNDGAADLGPAAPGTSPAIGTLTGGAWPVAFVDPSGFVVLVESGDRQDFQFGEAAPGTSPALVALPNGQWEAGYQTADGDLVTEGAGNHGDWSSVMSAGTSPVITRHDNELQLPCAGARLWGRAVCR